MAFLGIVFDADMCVEDLLPGGPAAKAGLQVGDLVTRVSALKGALARVVEESGAYEEVAGNYYGPGGIVTLRVRRGSAEHDVPVVLGEEEDRWRDRFLPRRSKPQVSATAPCGKKLAVTVEVTVVPTAYMAGAACRCRECRQWMEIQDSFDDL